MRKHHVPILLRVAGVEIKTSLKQIFSQMNRVLAAFALSKIAFELDALILGAIFQIIHNFLISGVELRIERLLGKQIFSVILS